MSFTVRSWREVVEVYVFILRGFDGNLMSFLEITSKQQRKGGWGGIGRGRGVGWSERVK